MKRRADALRRLLAAGLAAAVAAGCDGGHGEAQPAPDASRSETTPRFARRFLPVGSQWIPEAQLPREPQRTPKMVIWELSRSPGRDTPTPDEQRAADELLRRSLDAAERHGWFDFQQGMRDGYRLLFGDKRHYYNESYLFDDRLLDPDRPEFLMYYGTPRGQKLAGFMFYVREPGDPGPEIGGPLTRWHHHVWSTRMCLVRGLLSVGIADAQGRCARGVPTHRSPEMLHVWFLDHPDGPFATSMWLTPAQLEGLIERDELRAAHRRDGGTTARSGAP